MILCQPALLSVYFHEAFACLLMNLVPDYIIIVFSFIALSHHLELPICLFLLVRKMEICCFSNVLGFRLSYMLSLVPNVPLFFLSYDEFPWIYPVSCVFYDAERQYGLKIMIIWTFFEF